MARKDVLKGLLGPGPAVPPSAAPPAPPRPTGGAIGAVTRSIADLKARAVAEIDPHMIDAGGVQDRLESVASEDDALRESIATHGQQVPVLVRPHPEREGRYQIVYGRRRVLALRDLGRPVKALIRDLDDRELVLAQGQENTARRDLSFIEKVNFARQLQEMGYDRKVICDALSVDKTLASRMLSLAARLPAELIAGVGAAPSIGRDRWTAFAEHLAQLDADVGDLLGAMNLYAASDRSDDRFLAAWDYLEAMRRRRASGKDASAAAAPQDQTLTAPDGTPLGKVRSRGDSCTLRLQGAPVAEGFAPWLISRLPTLFAEWQSNPTDE
ncbi:MAG: plasmid partitioning protein RepB [Rhodobacteraceae bacterium]|nr:plasmid partitioning protein RepB [Paracoccaceae bacterium]